MASPVHSSWNVLTLSGELDMSRTDELNEMVSPLIGEDHVNAIVDLSQVTFMDSSAVRWLLGLQDRIDQIGGKLRLVAPENGNLMRLLSLTGLEDRFAVFPTRRQAEDGSADVTDAVDELLATFSNPDAARPETGWARYMGDVWEQATQAGYIEWTGLGHRLTAKGRARGSRIVRR